MIGILKNELLSIEEGIAYLEATDMAWTKHYTALCKKKRILTKTIKKIERLEAKYYG